LANKSDWHFHLFPALNGVQTCVMRIPLIEKSEAVRAHTGRISVRFQKTVPYACAPLCTHSWRLRKSLQLSSLSFRQPDRWSVLCGKGLQTSASDCGSWRKRYNASTPCLLKLYREITAVYYGAHKKQIYFLVKYGVAYYYSSWCI